MLGLTLNGFLNFKHSFFGLSHGFVNGNSHIGALTNTITDLAFLITNNNGPARLLLNQVGADRHWLGLVLRGVESLVAPDQLRGALLLQVAISTLLVIVTVLLGRELFDAPTGLLAGALAGR